MNNDINQVNDDPFAGCESLFNTPVPPDHSNPHLNLSTNESSNAQALSSTENGPSSFSNNNDNNNQKQPTDPKDKCNFHENSETSVYESLELVRDILKSNVIVIQSTTHNLDTFINNTNSKLEILDKHIQDLKTKAEERKSNIKNYIDNTIEETIQKHINNSENSQDDQNQSRSQKADSKAKGKEKNRSKKTNRELESLAYDFFSSAKSDNQPSSSKSKSRSRSRDTSQIPTFGNSLANIPTTATEAQVSYSTRTSNIHDDQSEVIDMTMIDEDSLKSRSNSPEVISTSAARDTAPSQTCEKSKRTMLPPTTSAKGSVRSATNQVSSASSSTTLNRSTKRSFTSLANGDTKSSSRWKRNPTSSIIGKKKTGFSSSGKKEFLYLVKTSDQPVSSATWQPKEDITDFTDKLLDLEQMCTFDDVDFRREIVLLREAQTLWDNYGVRKASIDNNFESGKVRKAPSRLF